jgi:multiple sugar transport system permease protein
VSTARVLAGSSAQPGPDRHQQLPKPPRWTRSRVAPNQRPGLFGTRRMTRTRLAGAIVLALLSVFPLLYMLSLSFQPVGDILSPTPELLPVNPTFANYISAWSSNSFSVYFANSAIVSVATIVLTECVAVLAALAFARYRFRMREVIFYLFLASLAVPAVELILPQYLLMQRLGLIDSRIGLILIYSSQNLPFAVFFLRGFFETIPKELEEAMRLDGAGTLRVLRSLIMPLSAPAIATVAVLTFNTAWDEFVVALTLINSPGKRTLPVGLEAFQGAHQTAWGPLFAASMIATVPTILVYVGAQRWFQRGFSVGALH